MKTLRTYILLNILILLSSIATADNRALSAEETAHSLYTGLKTGDTELVQTILDPQVLIFESGGVESSLQEYASHHMGADMAFMANMNREIISRKILEQGEICVIATQARLTGTYRNKQIDSVSDETLVLQKKEQGWRITHIHWSSR